MKYFVASTLFKTNMVRQVRYLSPCKRVVEHLQQWDETDTEPAMDWKIYVYIIKIHHSSPSLTTQTMLVQTSCNCFMNSAAFVCHPQLDYCTWDQTRVSVYILSTDTQRCHVSNSMQEMTWQVRRFWRLY